MRRPVIIGGIGVVIVAAAIALNYGLDWGRPSDQGAPPEPLATAEPRTSPPLTAPAEDALPQAREDAAERAAGPSPAEEVRPATPVEEALREVREEAPEVAALPPEGRAEGPVPPAPSFDVVRIERTGEAVMAGRAPPGAEVTILDHGEEIGRVTADRRGEWVWVPDKPFQPGGVELELSAELPGQEPVESKSTVVLVVPEPEKDIAGREAEEPSEALVLRVPKDLSGPTEVLQAPRAPGAVPTVQVGRLSLDVVDYDDTGRLILGGHAAPGARLQVYMDNALLGTAVANEASRWGLRPRQRVAPGLYTLRVDWVEADGTVVARIELPFSRAEAIQGMPGDAYVVVQPGNSLWRLARRTYGEGVRYTVIYQANEKQIRDPDLIYPGQVFMLPRSDERGSVGPARAGRGQF